MMYRYETHMHTCQSSACGKSTGAEHARRYKELGYDGIFITDHFFRGNCAVPRDLPWEEWVRRFCKGYEDAKAEGDRIGLQVFFAWEESIDGDDWLVYGLPPEWLLAHPEIARCTRQEQLTLAHADGGCVVQAHPFRQRDYIRRILLGPQFCDAAEVANQGNQPLDDVCALRYARTYGLHMTCGSDNHLSAPDRQPWGVAFEHRITCPADYVRAIRTREPMTLLCPPERFDPAPEMVNPEAWWLDDKENARLSGIDWLRLAV